MLPPVLRDFFDRNFPGDYSPKSVISRLDRHGIDKTVILALDWARSHHVKALSNEYVAELVQEYRDRFIGFASVDPLKGEAAADELEFAISDLGLRGLKLGPAIQLFYPNEQRCLPVYKRAEDLQIPILFHGGWTGFPNTSVKFGYPLFLDDVAMHFPKLSIIVAHLGGGFSERC